MEEATKTCIFPFIYKGLTHHTCTGHGVKHWIEDKYWCATEVNSLTDPQYVSGKWGNCHDSCPKDTSPNDGK